MTAITFTVNGTPAPQGSKTRTRYGMFESSRRVKPWREVVTQAASIAADNACLLGPLHPPYRVDMWFYIKKPRTTRATHPVAPTIGDLDKLARACGDALTTSGLIQDDRFIVSLHVDKEWAGEDGPGVIISVEEFGR
ncbi:RusA family crossover junction endodeoxyribonuclease [Microbacterium telephonicum]|uniref:Holliday junction resolvase RusA-like endonuclease n=1 Tax=Microbacterium telephonicum TaxID=1714841 RepID=A0A498C3B1_9MICO|nr:RusA family crossover junction endodeoxyribonuclease [Microbacterium telephonicum]RLK47640.1 Holliday junction resolvase RusA-like endonuclease [Microbacterium telephonicum]